MRIKIRQKKGILQVQLLIQHPMENGLREDPDSGEKLPANYIQNLTCEYAGRVVFTADFGRAISENPYISFAFATEQPDQQLLVRWVDNQGDSEQESAALT